jgi:DNA-binding MurR/RpiR family transcriptional regulator
MDIVHQLRSQTHKLSPTEQLIAQACLDDIGFAASATIDQLAERAGVSRSALSRFAKTVGCRDIREMRMQLAQAGSVGRRFLVPAAPWQAETPAQTHGQTQTETHAEMHVQSPVRSPLEAPDGAQAEMPRRGSAFGAVAASPHGNPAAQGAAPTSSTSPSAAQASGRRVPPLFFSHIVSDIEAALHRHLDMFDADTMAQAVALLAHAPMVYAFGVGGTSSMGATELQHRLVRLGAPIAAYHDPILMRMASAAVSSQDVVVALSLSGITPDLLAAVRVAKRYGAKVLAIAPRNSALGEMADTVLPMMVDETDFIYKPTAARYGMLLAIDILVTELALLQPDHHQERLRRVKLALDDYRRGGERLPLGD